MDFPNRVAIGEQCIKSATPHWPAAVAAVTSCFITNRGRAAWFIGALLLFIYTIFALTLYVVPPGTHAPA
jgi:Ca2+:H+ antiporter